MCVPSRHFGETQRRGRQCAAHLAGLTKGDHWLLQPEIKVGLIASLFVRRHLPFFETIEGAEKEK
jgi:hypothetical protein